ncbi:MAG: InlB B-repeat-containing protein, partial [Bacilli bacterium]|nr:InlB B-repeat-containing protein [Bacilli bacterium]
MMELTKKRSLKFFIGSAIALVFAFVFAFVASPKVYAATSTIESLTLANINSGNAQGKYGNFSWDNSKLKSVSNSEITTDRNKDPFCIVWTRPSNGSYASALAFSVNVVDSVGAIDIKYNDTVPSYISPGEKQSGTLTNNVNSLSSKYEKIYFYISCSYMYNDVKLTSVSIQIKATTYPISFSKGTGIKAAFLSTNNSATSGSASGTAFAKFDTVYCFAKLDKGYKAQSGWTLISGTANSEDAIYRVGSYTVSSASYSFGTLNAIAKTASIYRYGNGGSNLGNVSLTYGSSAELGTPTRTGYEFKGWNTAQNGTGNTISSSLTAEEVNTIIDAGTPTSVYAQWSINAAGVDGLIENIGWISYTSDSKSKIETVREAYNSLDSEEQALVTNYDLLTAAETAYNTLKTNAINDAIAKIDAIGTVAYTNASKALIDAAREAYNVILEEDQDEITNVAKLTDAETLYNNVNNVVTKIDAIGTVAYTNASKALIDDAKAAYDTLKSAELAIIPADKV